MPHVSARLSHLSPLPFSAEVIDFGGGGGRSVQTHNPVEPRGLVALRLAVDLVLAGAELSEVLGGARDDVLEELKGDAA